jgi:hypothetical protein
VGFRVSQRLELSIGAEEVKEETSMKQISFMLGFFFDPEDRSEMLLEISFRYKITTWPYIPDDTSLV